MSTVDKSLEWQSILNALSKIPVEQTRAIFGTRGAIAYTDGACIKNPGGPAGWSAILVSVDSVVNGAILPQAERIECFGHIPKAPATTNNRAEISAVLAAMSIAPRDYPLTIYSDSEYTIKTAQGLYKGKANPDLWSLYQILLRKRSASLQFEWVRGHAGHAQNERADELAGLGAWNNDQQAFERWQESQTPEARTGVAPAQLATLRQQAQGLKALFDTIAVDGGRVSLQERKFVDDMVKHLQKNNFAPTEKQRNWLQGLATKFKV